MTDFVVLPLTQTIVDFFCAATVGFGVGVVVTGEADGVGVASTVGVGDADGVGAGAGASCDNFTLIRGFEKLNPAALKYNQPSCSVTTVLAT